MHCASPLCDCIAMYAAARYIVWFKTGRVSTFKLEHTNEAMTNALLGVNQNSSNVFMNATMTGTSMRLTSTLDTPTTATATDDALAIPEILENILADLSFHDLNRAKRTSRDFDLVVNDWPSLRKARFVQEDHAADNRVLHLFQFRGCFWSHSSFSPPRMSDLPKLVYHEAVRIVHLHPFLTLRCTAGQVRVSQMEVDFPNLHEIALLPAGGSWEHALLTQPPVERMTLEIHGKLLGAGFRVDVQDKSGIRLGLIARALRKVMAKIPPPRSGEKLHFV